jgi:hypothetical protein
LSAIVRAGLFVHHAMMAVLQAAMEVLTLLVVARYMYSYGDTGMRNQFRFQFQNR